MLNLYSKIYNELMYELSDELKSNIDKQQELLNCIECLPKGHINILNRNNKGYYYLTYRDGSKIKNKYLGVVGKVDLTETISNLKKRESLVTEYKKLRQEEKKLNKLIKKYK